MKEHIYTIALTDALEEDGECLLCLVEKKINENAVEYYTGAAMMEPDVRCETNEKGFCPVHYKRMKEVGNTLSVALVLQTRIKELNALLKPDEIKKKRLFESKDKKGGCADNISSAMSSCAACERVSRQMDDCISNFAYLLSADEEFRTRFLKSKGLCMKHFEKAIKITDEKLREEMILHQKKEMERLLSDINRFVDKFDYRNADMPWGNAKDAPDRAIFKLRGEYDGKF